MSPYRVLAQNRDEEDPFVLAAMLSIDKKTGDRNIYIVEKISANSSDAVSYRQAAYTYTCRKNSNILARYCIRRAKDTSKYTVIRCSLAGNLQTTIFQEEYTQAACLSSAMHDYCAMNKFDIISVL